ncbi:hypothetical protein RQP46_009136 [Phenoliferia psychrophenolica]
MSSHQPSTYNFFLAGGPDQSSAPPVEAAPSKPKEPDAPFDAAALSDSYKKLKDKQQKELEALLGKLLKENAEMKKAAEEQKHELLMFRSSTREQTKRSFAVAIMDFSLDMFTPSVFHRPNAGQYAAQRVRDALRANLPASAPGSQLLVFVFMSRKILKDMIAEGVVRDKAELDAFILAFNTTHPLFMIVESDASPQVIVERERALATTFAGLSECQTLLVGRWALDVSFAEMVAPTPSKDKGKDKNKGKEGEDDSESPKEKKAPKGPPLFPSKIVFIEPPPFAVIHTDVLKREPNAANLSGVVRMIPMIRGRGEFARPKLNYSLPLYAQQPRICFPH